MASNRGKGDPMAGLLSGLGGIDPNLFNKPTMGQLKNKQQSPAIPPKSAVPAPRSDTIAAVGSPGRPEPASDSFSSQKSTHTRANPERSGAVADDLDSFFGSAKPSAAPSQANSYAPSPANMASPAASLGHPDNQQDTDFFGSFGSPAQSSARSSAAPAQQSQHQQAAMDPFDLFGEGSTVPATGTMAAGSPHSPADDSLFGGIEGHQGSYSETARHRQEKGSARTPEPQGQDMLPARSPKSVSSQGQPPSSQGRSMLPRCSSSFTNARSPDSRTAMPDAFATDPYSATPKGKAPPMSGSSKGTPLPSSSSAKGSLGRQHGSSSSLDTTAGVQGSPSASASPLSGLSKAQRTPPIPARQLSDDGRGSSRGPLEEGASSSGARHPDPYMHEDPYMGGALHSTRGKQGSGGSGSGSGSGNVEQTAKQWLTGGQKWLKSAGKKIANAAKESASEIQKRLESVDVKMPRGKGIKVGDDGEEVPAYYHQWATKIQDMSPARQADVLDQLGEDDRLIVQRILDHNAVQRSHDSAVSGLSQRSSHARPASPTGSDSPPPYSAVAGSRATKPASHQASRSVSPQEGHQSPEQTDRLGRRMEDAHSASIQQQKKKATPALDMGIFDFDSQSSSELEQQQPRDSQAHESRAAEEESMRAATPRQQPQAEMQSQRQQQQQQAADADFLGFGSQDATEEAFMPESPTSDSSPAQPSQPAYPPPPDANPPATPDNLADFFSTPPAGAPASPPHPRAQSSTAHIDDMFSAAPKPTLPVDRPQAAAAPPASSSRAGGRGSHGAPGGSAGGSARAGAGVSQPNPKPAPKAAPASMIDFGNEAALLAEHPDLYKGLEEVPGEPAYRKELRQKRVREMHQRMQAQLAEKQARDASESSEKEEKVDLRNRVVKPKIEAWTQGKKENIRALLSTLHTVLWEGSGWNPPQMTDLVETGKVKKQYMKANLIIHPDKVKQKGGTVEQIVIADMAFDVLKNAWGKFESGELRK